MGSRKKKGDGKGGGESWEKSEDILQAVVLGDSFNYKFLPITREKPRVRSKFNHFHDCVYFSSFHLYNYC